MPDKKEDRRTIYSKRFIRESLFELMKEKPLKKISVKEICEKADVNRSTFYSYYTDIYDLHKKITDEYFEKQQNVIEYSKLLLSSKSDVTNLSVNDYYELALYYFNTIKENSELYKFVFSQNASNIIHVAFGRSFFDGISQAVSPQLPIKYIDNFKRSYTFISGGTTALIMDWLNKGCADSVEHMARQVAYYYHDIYCAYRINKDK